MLFCFQKMRFSRLLRHIPVILKSHGLETKDVVLYLDPENSAVRSVVGIEIILQLILLVNHDHPHRHHSSRVRFCGPVSPSSNSLFKGLPSLFIDKYVS
jgi:hypothetical protein